MSARQHWCDCAQAPVFEGMCNGCDWPTRLDARDAAIEAECVPLDDTRICPGCNGLRVVELSHGHDPYTGERVSLDTCPDCDGTGEIEVAPIEEEDLPE